MRYNVAQLLQEHVGSIRVFEVDEPPYAIDRDIDLTKPLTGQLRATRINRGVVAHAELETEVHLPCSRCVEDVVTPLQLQFTEEFYPTVDLRTGLPVQVPEDATGFMLTEAHEVDLTEPVRQYVLLALPMKPLCRVDCAGLCPRCGQNLNDARCDCPEEPADSRLGPLAEWLRSNRVN